MPGQLLYEAAAAMEEEGLPPAAARSPPRRDDDDEVLLSGIFSLAPSLKVDYAVRLTRGAELLLCPAAAAGGRLERLRLADCIGCYAFQRSKDSRPAAYFTVFCYSFKKGWWDLRESRRRVAKTFRVLASREAEENRLVAETWARTIRELSTPRSPQLAGESLSGKQATKSQEEAHPELPEAASVNQSVSIS